MWFSFSFQFVKQIQCIVHIVRFDFGINETWTYNCGLKSTELQIYSIAGMGNDGFKAKCYYWEIWLTNKPGSKAFSEKYVAWLNSLWLNRQNHPIPITYKSKQSSRFTLINIFAYFDFDRDDAGSVNRPIFRASLFDDFVLLFCLRFYLCPGAILDFDIFQCSVAEYHTFHRL